MEEHSWSSLLTVSFCISSMPHGSAREKLSRSKMFLSSILFKQVVQLTKAAGYPIDLPAALLGAAHFSPGSSKLPQIWPFLRNPVSKPVVFGISFQNNDLCCNWSNSFNVQKQLLIHFLINTHQLATVWQDILKNTEL